MKSRFLNFKQPRTPRQNNSPASYYSTPPVNNKTTSSHFKESARTERSKQEKSKEKQEILLQDRLLDAALRRVSDYGWSDDCVAAGARDLGISSGAAGIFDDGAGELVGRYIERCNERMASKLQDSIWVKENGLDGAGVMKKILTAVKMRIEMIEPYHASWGQAMALQTLPANVPLAAQRTAKMVDEIWHFAGDKATDFNWYSKRGILAAAYHATELFWLTDHSRGKEQTWWFLEKTLKDATNIGSGIGEALGQVSQSVNVILQSGSSIFPFTR